jgi:thiamine-monophosphate kinase
VGSKPQKLPYEQHGEGNTESSAWEDPVMTVGETGEFGLISSIIARLGTGPTCLLGPGDDAAIVAAPDGRVVASTDVLVDGRHFRRDWSTAVDIGHRAAAANLADIAAMGAVPTALLVALCAPPDLDSRWVEQLAVGLSDECARVGASVVGGDIAASPTLTIAVTALGDLHDLPPVRRSGARPGDVIAVAGRLGWAAAGFTILTRGFRSPRALVEAHRRPDPPYPAGPVAARLGATSMIDISDGLVADLGHVARASGVSIELRSDAIEVPAAMTDAAAALGVDPYQWVFAGGDDHALVATFPAATKLTREWRTIGRVRDGAGVTVDGRPFEGPGGWDHFR